MTWMTRLVVALSVCLAPTTLWAATPEELAQQQALPRSMEVKPGQLKPLRLETPLVADGKAQAVICHADDPAWQRAAQTVQRAVRKYARVHRVRVVDNGGER